MNRAPLRAELNYYGVLRPPHLLMWEVDAQRNDREYGHRLRWRQFYDVSQATPGSPGWGVTRITWRDTDLSGFEGEPIAYPFHWPGHCAEVFPPQRIAELESAGWKVAVSIYEPTPPPRPITFAAPPAPSHTSALGASCANCHVAIRRPDARSLWSHTSTRSTYCPQIHPGHWPVAR